MAWGWPCGLLGQARTGDVGVPRAEPTHQGWSCPGHPAPTSSYCGDPHSLPVLPVSSPDLCGTMEPGQTTQHQPDSFGAVPAPQPPEYHLGLPGVSAQSTQECRKVAAGTGRSLCSAGRCCLCPTGGTQGVLSSVGPAQSIAAACRARCQPHAHTRLRGNECWCCLQGP